MPTELTAREDWEAGNLVERFKPYGGDIDGKDRIVLFIHGFNNDRATALRYYNDCYESLAKRFHRHRRVMDQEIVYLTWPGDQFESRRLSALAYRAQLPKAKRVGRSLAVYLRQYAELLGRPLRVACVAHSLGSRVTLEMLRELDLQLQPHLTSAVVKVEEIVLMAPAVPVGCCEPGDRFGAKLAEREIVLYSPNDKALGWVFKLGELIDDCGGWLPQAVGRHGNPRTRWTTATDTRLGHGDYWYKSVAVERIAALFGWEVPRRLAERRLSSHGLEPRVLGRKQLQSI